MGSLEAYLVALIFAFSGPSVWALRAEPILLSLGVVWLTWKLATALADAAQLSSANRGYFINIAVLMAALSPLYDTVLELRTLGGYIETFIRPHPSPIAFISTPGPTLADESIISRTHAEVGG